MGNSLSECEESSLETLRVKMSAFVFHTAVPGGFTRPDEGTFRLHRPVAERSNGRSIRVRRMSTYLDGVSAMMGGNAGF